MSVFKPYRRKQIAELRPYRDGETLAGVSISVPDQTAGSPKTGDMIARNPKNHKDHKQYRQSASEHSLQVNVLEYLKLNAHRDVFWFAIPNAGKRSWRAAKQMKNEGLTAGVADLCIMYLEGRTLWLELKTGKGQQTDAQRVFEGVCVTLGHAYYLARSFDEAIDVLRRWHTFKENR